MTSKEQRPLLNSTHTPLRDVDVVPVEESTDQVKKAVTPLPMGQVSILLLLQVAEVLTSTVTSPFISQLVNESGVTGGDSSKVGYYAGMIESILFLTQSAFTLQHGRISDRIGRRPVLLFGLFGLSISIFSIGLSKAFGRLVFSRALAGALNGNLGVAKSMMMELTDETNQAQYFSFYPIVLSAGTTLGPLIGGSLSHPAALLPSVFDTPFWNKYLYFLPCLVTSTIIVCIFATAALFLKEASRTLNTRTNAKEHISPSAAEYGAVNEQTPATPKRAPSIRSVLTKRACIAIVNYAFLAFTDISYKAVLPIMFAASIENGGLGLEPRSIGTILAAQGIFYGIIQVRFFASIHKRFGGKRTFTAGMTAYGFIILSLPLMNALARRGMMRAMWVAVGANIVVACFAPMSFGCIIIIVTSAAPSKNSLGTLNGIAQTTISLIRAIGPATATSLFALSAERKLLGGWFVYAVLIGVNVCALFASRWLKDEKRAFSNA